MTSVAEAFNQIKEDFKINITIIFFYSLGNCLEDEIKNYDLYNNKII